MILPLSILAREVRPELFEDYGPPHTGWEEEERTEPLACYAGRRGTTTTPSTWFPGVAITTRPRIVTTTTGSGWCRGVGHAKHSDETGVGERPTPRVPRRIAQPGPPRSKRGKAAAAGRSRQAVRLKVTARLAETGPREEGRDPQLRLPSCMLLPLSPMDSPIHRRRPSPYDLPHHPPHTARPRTRGR